MATVTHPVSYRCASCGREELEVDLPMRAAGMLLTGGAGPTATYTVQWQVSGVDLRGAQESIKAEGWSGSLELGAIHCPACTEKRAHMGEQRS